MDLFSFSTKSRTYNRLPILFSEQLESRILLTSCPVVDSDPQFAPAMVICGTKVVSVEQTTRLETGNVYHLINSQDFVGLRWTDAADAARRLGGHLVTIDSAEESAWLQEAFPDVLAWSGLFRSAGLFRWQSGADSEFRNWDSNFVPPAGADFVAFSTFSLSQPWIAANNISSLDAGADVWGIVEVPASRVQLRGDFNGDRQVDIIDLNLLATAIRLTAVDLTFDLTADDLVNQADRQFFVEELLGTVAGDANLDGSVNFADFLTLSHNFGKTNAAWEMGDFAGGPTVDFGDFLSLSSNFGFVSDQSRYLRVVAKSEVRGFPWTTISELDVVLPSGETADKSLWSLVSVSSEEVEAEVAPATFAFDSMEDTFWHTVWAPEGNDHDPKHPHEIVIDLGTLVEVANVRYLPRQDIQNGRVADYQIFVSIDSKSWGPPIAAGTFANSTDPQYAIDPGLPPTASDLVFALHEDVATLMDLSSGAQDPDSLTEKLYATIVGRPEYGSLERHSNGSFLYIPDLDFWGNDSFTYQIADGVNRSNIARVDINILPVADPPVVAHIDDLNVDVTNGLIEAEIDIFDADGDPLDVVGYGTARNPLADIRDTYGLVHVGDDYLNLTGLNEKWLFGSDESAFMLLPNGDLVQWLGTYGTTGVRESLIARLDPSVYQDPSLLWNASEEIVVPIAISVDMENSLDGRARIVAVPESGLYGDISVHIVASDGETTRSQQFQVTIQPEPDSLSQERQVVEDLSERTADLTLENMPAFVGEIEANLPALSATAQDDLSSLLATLKSLYSAAQTNIAEAQRYREGLTANSEQRIGEIEAILEPYERLQKSYEGAWAAYTARRVPGSVADPNIPPIFIHGKTLPNPLQVYQGEAVLLDLQAVHPEGIGVYRFNVDYDRTPGWMYTGNYDGIFRWDVPANASGIYNFSITAEGGARQDKKSTLPFSIEVLPNAPSIQSLTIASTVVSDLGTDPIQLTANGVVHPRQLDDVVIRYYQDIDGNGLLDPFVDRRLGTSPAGGSWTGNPFPISSEQVTFFAQAELQVESRGDVFSHGFFYDYGEDVQSHPVSVTVPVFKSPQLASSPLTPEPFTVIGFAGPTQTYEKSVMAIPFPYLTPRLIATYGDHASAVLTSDSTGLQVQRHVDVNGVGIGTPVGAPTKVGDWGGDVAVVSDDQGNLTIAFATGNAGGTNPDASAGSALWLMKVDKQNAVTVAPKKLASIDNSEGFSFALDVNGLGDGIIAWKGYYASASVHLRTFTQGGQVLGDVHELPFPGGFHDGGDWRATAVNDVGQYLLNFGGYEIGSGINVAGNLHSDREPSVVPVSMFAVEAAMNDQGWTILTNGSVMQAFGPDGKAIGLPLTIPGPAGFRRIFDLRFSDDQTLELYNERNTEYTMQAFSIRSQPGLEIVQADLISETTPHAGTTASVEFVLENKSLKPYPSTEVAFYLSRDEVFDVADRQVGVIATTAGIGIGEVKQFAGSIDLPVNLDPYWLQGSSELYLFAALPASGSFYATPIGRVDTVELDPSSVTGPHAPTISYRERASIPTEDWIRADIVAAQGGGENYLKSDAFVELIGYQLIAGLKQVEREAHVGVPSYHNLPTEITSRYGSLMNRIRTSLEAYNLKRFNLQLDADDALQKAESARALGLRDADAQLQSVEQDAQTLLDQLVLPLEAIVNTAQDSFAGRVQKEISRLQSRIQQDEQRVRGLLTSAANTDREVRGLLETLFLDPRELDNLRSLEALAQKFRDDANAIQNTVNALKQNMLNDAFAIRQQVQQDIDLEVQSAHEQIEWAERTYNTIVSFAQRDHRTATGQIEADYERAKNTITATQQSTLGQVVSGSVVPTLADAVNANHGVVNFGKSQIQQIKDDAKKLDEQNPFGSVQENIDTAKASVEIAQGVLEELQEKLAPVVDAFKQAGGKFSDWGKETGGKVSDWTKDSGEDVAEWAKDQIDDVLDDEVIAYKGVTDFVMSLNLSNGAFYLDAKAGPGVGYDSRKLNELLESGSPSIPDIDPVDAVKKIFSARIEQTDDYDEIRDSLYQEFGAQSVYFSSRRFVDHFGAESAAEIVVETILFGGAAAAKDAIADVGEHLRLELNDIISWLEQRGAEQIEAVVPELIRALLTGQNFRSPHIELRWNPIQYAYKLKPEPLLGKVVSTVSGDETLIDEFVSKTQQNSRHAGFAIIWQIPDPGDPYDHFSAYLKDLELGSFTGNVLTPELVADSFKVLVNENLPDNLKLSDEAVDILNALGPLVGEVGKFEKLLAKTITDVLSFDLSGIEAKIQQLKTLQNGSFKLDFQGTPAALRLEEFLKKITFGNRRQAEVQEFSFDLTTFTLTIKGTLCHKHSWGSIGAIIEGLQSKLS